MLDDTEEIKSMDIYYNVYDRLLLQDEIISKSKIHLCCFSNFNRFLTYMSITFSFKWDINPFLVSIAYMKFRTLFGRNV